MDKKLIEKYLKLYPEIDEEIKGLEDDLTYFEDEKLKYENKEETDNEMLDLIMDGIKEKKDILHETKRAKIMISVALSKMNPGQRKIIELRFWNSDPFPAEWADVAKKLQYHRKSLEKIYSQIVSEIVIS